MKMTINYITIRPERKETERHEYWVVLLVGLEGGKQEHDCDTNVVCTVAIEVAKHADGLRECT
jgi:hypothetical protein